MLTSGRMADYAIVPVIANEIDRTQYMEISKQADQVLATAKPDDIIMLQIRVNSPKSLLKALPLTEENLVKIAQID